MCISQGVELLLIWFENHDSFRLKQDYNSLDWALLQESKYNEQERKACIILALDELVTENVIKGASDEKDDNDEGTWVLMNSHMNSPRQIQISAQTCDNVSTVVNSFLPMLDLNVPQRSDPKNLGEADIIILLSVVNSFAKRLDEMEKNLNNGDSKKKK